jgi:hypothetical protein
MMMMTMGLRQQQQRDSIMLDAWCAAWPTLVGIHASIIAQLVIIG